MASFSTAIEDLHPDVLARALRRMDGPTLAAVGCSSSSFRSLTAEPSIWRDLCLDAWPSLRLLPVFPLLSPRSFFADSYPFPDTDASSDPEASAKPSLPPGRVFSAVDIRHAGVLVLSRVVETDTSCPWFLGSAFRIDALERTKSLPATGWQQAAGLSPAGLELSWTVVDAATQRAVNVSSRSPVAVDRHWYTGEALVRFTTVLGGCAVSVVVACGEEAGQVREVSLTVEDEDGIAMDGRKGLGILTAAMNGRRRRRRGVGEEREAKRRYHEYLRRKEMRKERKARREALLDLCCTAFGTLVFFAILLLVAFK